MNILLIEDDCNLSDSLLQYLTCENFVVTAAHSYQEAILQKPELFDLIILDWNLGDGEGIDLLKVWKKSSALKPIIFLTAKADLSNKVQSLEAGANDYLTKPFEPRELLARIRVQLRTSQNTNELITVGALDVDMNLRKVKFRKNEINFSKTEFELLSFFIRNPEKAFSREELLKEVWGYNNSPTTRTVDTHILQLRQKLSSEIFETVHGIGYRMKRPK